MTVEADITSVLLELAVGPVYPDLAPANVARPFLVYQQVGGVAPVFLERAVPSKQNGRFQINVWSLTRKEAKAIAINIESAMVNSILFDAKPLSAPLSVYDEDTELRGSTQDFTIWSDR